MFSCSGWLEKWVIYSKYLFVGAFLKTNEMKMKMFFLFWLIEFLLFFKRTKQKNIYEFILPTDLNKSWFGLSKPVIIPKLLPTTPPMPKPNFKSLWTTEWCRWPELEFWFTMCECECECEWPWSCWCVCCLLFCCWADLISWFFSFSCSSRSRRAYCFRRNEKKKRMN